jgi:hypothetical protein
MSSDRIPRKITIFQATFETKEELCFIVSITGLGKSNAEIDHFDLKYLCSRSS